MKKINKKKKKQKEREESLLTYFLGFVFPCKFLDFSSLTFDLVFFRYITIVMYIHIHTHTLY